MLQSSGKTGYRLLPDSLQHHYLLTHATRAHWLDAKPRRASGFVQQDAAANGLPLLPTESANLFTGSIPASSQLKTPELGSQELPTSAWQTMAKSWRIKPATYLGLDVRVRLQTDCHSKMPRGAFR
jgi:hypothetical protein